MNILIGLRALLALLPSLWVAFALFYIFYLESHNTSALPILGTDSNLVAWQGGRELLIASLLFVPLAFLLEAVLLLRDAFRKKHIAPVEAAAFLVSAVAFPFAVCFDHAKLVQWLVD